MLKIQRYTIYQLHAKQYYLRCASDWVPVLIYKLAKNIGLEFVNRNTLSYIHGDNCVPLDNSANIIRDILDAFHAGCPPTPTTDIWATRNV